jgi:hypothetical protein
MGQLAGVYAEAAAMGHTVDVMVPETPVADASSAATAAAIQKLQRQLVVLQLKLSEQQVTLQALWAEKAEWLVERDNLRAAVAAAASAASPSGLESTTAATAPPSTTATGPDALISSRKVGFKGSASSDISTTSTLTPRAASLSAPGSDANVLSPTATSTVTPTGAKRGMARMAAMLASRVTTPTGGSGVGVGTLASPADRTAWLEVCVSFAIWLHVCWLRQVMDLSGHTIRDLLCVLVGGGCDVCLAARCDGCRLIVCRWNPSLDQPNPR